MFLLGIFGKPLLAVVEEPAFPSPRLIQEGLLENPERIEAADSDQIGNQDPQKRPKREGLRSFLGCSGKLPLFSFGFNSCGIISVGVTAHGVITVGVVSMGVVPVGVVSMGVVSAGVVSMGLVGLPSKNSMVKYDFRELSAQVRRQIHRSSGLIQIHMPSTAVPQIPSPEKHHHHGHH